MRGLLHAFLLAVETKNLDTGYGIQKEKKKKGDQK